ncbi:MAG: phytoene/squalene synthase family protein [Planctomycetales bacterium]|nr:phytoene/squalene synthase family protein [Planctomycetales bacterium]
MSADGAALEAAYRHCEEVTRRSGTNFAWAFALLPAGTRRAIRVAYAFNRALDDAVDGPAAPDEKRARLARLRAGLDRCYDGGASDPLFLPLGDVAHRHRVPRRLFDEMIAGAEMDLDRRRYGTFDELRVYCEKVAAAPGLLCLRLFGCEDPAAEPPAVALGIAMQLTNILRDVREDLGRDRVYLPLEDLARFGAREEDLRQGVLDDRLRALLQFEAARAEEQFERSRPLGRFLSRRSRVCPAVLRSGYRAILREIARRGYDVFRERVTLSRLAKARAAATGWLRSWAPW